MDVVLVTMLQRKPCTANDLLQPVSVQQTMISATDHVDVAKRLKIPVPATRSRSVRSQADRALCR